MSEGTRGSDRRARLRRPVPGADRRPARGGADVSQDGAAARPTWPSRQRASGGWRGSRATMVGANPFGGYVRGGARRVRRRRVAASARIRRCARRSRSARSTRPTTFRCSSTASRRRPIWSSEGARPGGNAASVPLLWTTGTGLSQEPSRSRDAGGARGAGAAGAVDGARPRLPRDVLGSRRRRPGAGTARRWRHANVAVGNVEEVAVARGEEPRGAGRTLWLTATSRWTRCSTSASSWRSEARGARSARRDAR